MTHSQPQQISNIRNSPFVDGSLFGTDTVDFYKFQVDRPYEAMNITGVSGITKARKATLKALGAIEAD